MSDLEKTDNIPSQTDRPITDVIKREYIGLLPCYDIEVDSEDHLFVLANGMVCSNSSKHTAGGFQGQKKTFSGFNYLNQFFQSPEVYKDKAPIAFSNGVVQSIYEAPQGGQYIKIADKDYYVEPDTLIFVKKGDTVERGQQLADGLIDPEEVTQINGIGEGRRRLSEISKQIFDDSGTKANKRNLEVIARAYINKVEITDPDGCGDYLPGDVVSYNQLETNYTPNKNSVNVLFEDKDYNTKLVDKYLQQPVLHYTIGTQLTPSMVKRIKESGISKSVLVSDDDVGFKPIYYRLREATTKGSDKFIEKGVASYQKRNYIDSAVRGHETDIKHNINPFARITFPNFAKNVSQTGKF